MFETFNPSNAEYENHFEIAKAVKKKAAYFLALLTEDPIQAINGFVANIKGLVDLPNIVTEEHGAIYHQLSYVLMKSVGAILKDPALLGNEELNIRLHELDRMVKDKLDKVGFGYSHLYSDQIDECLYKLFQVKHNLYSMRFLQACWFRLASQLGMAWLGLEISVSNIEKYFLFTTFFKIFPDETVEYLYGSKLKSKNVTDVYDILFNSSSYLKLFSNIQDPTRMAELKSEIQFYENLIQQFTHTDNSVKKLTLDDIIEILQIDINHKYFVLTMLLNVKISQPAMVVNTFIENLGYELNLERLTLQHGGSAIVEHKKTGMPAEEFIARPYHTHRIAQISHSKKDDKILQFFDLFNDYPSQLLADTILTHLKNIPNGWMEESKYENVIHDVYQFLFERKKDNLFGLIELVRDFIEFTKMLQSSHIAELKFKMLGKIADYFCLSVGLNRSIQLREPNPNCDELVDLGSRLQALPDSNCPLYTANFMKFLHKNISEMITYAEVAKSLTCYSEQLRHSQFELIEEFYKNLISDPHARVHTKNEEAFFHEAIIELTTLFMLSGNSAYALMRSWDILLPYFSNQNVKQRNFEHLIFNSRKFINLLLLIKTNVDNFSHFLAPGPDGLSIVRKDVGAASAIEHTPYTVILGAIDKLPEDHSAELSALKKQAFTIFIPGMIYLLKVNAADHSELPPYNIPQLRHIQFKPLKDILKLYTDLSPIDDVIFLGDKDKKAIKNAYKETANIAALKRRQAEKRTALKDRAKSDFWFCRLFYNEITKFGHEDALYLRIILHIQDVFSRFDVEEQFAELSLFKAINVMRRQDVDYRELIIYTEAQFAERFKDLCALFNYDFVDKELLKTIWEKIEKYPYLYQGLAHYHKAPHFYAQLEAQNQATQTEAPTVSPIIETPPAKKVSFRKSVKADTNDAVKAENSRLKAEIEALRKEKAALQKVVTTTTDQLNEAIGKLEIVMAEARQAAPVPDEPKRRIENYPALTASLIPVLNPKAQVKQVPEPVHQVPSVESFTSEDGKLRPKNYPDLSGSIFGPRLGTASKE